MPETFRTQRERFLEALDQADDGFTKARGLLDDLPASVRTTEQARQLVEAHQTMRDTLRSQLRSLEKL